MRVLNMNTIIKAVSIATIFCLGSPVLAKDKYTVALDGTFAPHAMPKLGGGIEGFNVDLANIIGDRLGVEMNIVATQWSGILPGLQAGTYDFVVAPTTITEERAGSLLFSEGYLNTDFQFLVANNAPEVTDIKEFKSWFFKNPFKVLKRISSISNENIPMTTYPKKKRYL